MSKHIHINMPTPCHESWDKMKPVEKGRYCDSCQKQVVDFTKMNDLQLITFFQKSSKGTMCGRFMQDQLDRNIDIPQKRIPWVKYFFQFLLPGFILSCGSRAVGKVNVSQSEKEIVSKTTYKQTIGIIMVEPEIITQGEVAEMDSIVEYEKKRNINFDEAPALGEQLELGQIEHCTVSIMQKESFVVRNPVSINITGRVVNNNGQPIPYASVFIKGTTIGAASDSAGNFILKYNGADKQFTLEGSSVGFEKILSVVDLDNMDENVILTLDSNVLLGDVVVGGWIETKGRVITGAVGSIKKSNLLDSLWNKILPSQNMFRLYPNPVKRNTTLNIELNKQAKGNYLFQLVTLSGQIIFTKENQVEKYDRLVKIDIPSVAAGVYFLKATHEQSAKGFSEKIIIE